MAFRDVMRARGGGRDEEKEGGESKREREGKREALNTKPESHIHEFDGGGEVV